MAANSANPIPKSEFVTDSVNLRSAVFGSGSASASSSSSMARVTKIGNDEPLANLYYLAINGEKRSLLINLGDFEFDLERLKAFIFSKMILVGDYTSTSSNSGDEAVQPKIDEPAKNLSCNIAAILRNMFSGIRSIFSSVRVPAPAPAPVESSVQVQNLHLMSTSFSNGVRTVSKLQNIIDENTESIYAAFSLDEVQKMVVSRDLNEV